MNATEELIRSLKHAAKLVLNRDISPDTKLIINKHIYLAADCIQAFDALAKRAGWQPIETAPRDGTYILLAGPSGYVTTPYRCEVCRYNDGFRPRQPWVDFRGDSFLDGGEAPTHWMPLPPAPVPPS